RAAGDEPHAALAQLQHVAPERLRRLRVGADDLGAGGTQQPGRGHAALGEADHGHAPPGERLEIPLSARYQVEILLRMNDHPQWGADRLTWGPRHGPQTPNARG